MNKSEFFAEARTDGMGPLSGLMVLEATTSWAGPMAGCILADFGAEVVKVEHPDGEITRISPPLVPAGAKLSFLNENVNRNKKSLSLDMRTDGDREVFLALAKHADVVLENFKPGTMADWGLGYSHVKAVKPDIVYVSISGFGQFGPMHDRVGYDPIAQAFTGWMSLNGEADGGPMKAPTFLGDDMAGMYGALSTLAALRHRDATGEGQHVDVALVDSLFAHCNFFPSIASIGLAPERLGNQFPGAAPFSCFACQDGHVFAGVALDSHWVKLLGAMGRDDLVDDERYATIPERVAHRDEVNAIVAEWCTGKTQSEVIEILTQTGIPVSPVNDFSAAAAHPHIAAREMLQMTTLSDGTRAPLVGPAPKFSRTPVRIRKSSSTIGADNDEILARLHDRS
jgi:crotonobetainyl-CoA:carnitine CoA-transferase CaiB-like acyl-CoA transferase|tara:strand:+ start:537 stop:1727 length:1191 start_codon:yes stop_codon:yes gene_type:complete